MNTPPQADLTCAILRERLHYDPLTGIFTWKVSFGVGANSRVGKVAGSYSDGYVTIRIDRRTYRAHRLAWLYTTGEWPVNQIDHWDTDRGNNRFTNLRDVPSRVNAQNRRNPSIVSAGGVIGVRKRGEKFIAKIAINGRYTHLGMFETADLAHAAYVEAKRKFHEGCTL